MKIGLALSGGGIRGIAHAGVLKALEENNIRDRYNRRDKFWWDCSIFICNGLFT